MAASILFLPDDCLFKVISFIDDPNSFYSIALTCKRFSQMTENTRSVLHTNVLRAKAEYFIKCYVAEIDKCDHPALSYNNDRFPKLRNLLRDYVRFIVAKRTVTFDKVMDVWQRKRPVAAKLLTWLRSQESWIDEHFTYGGLITKCERVILHLPSCGKRMVIESFENYPKLRIHVTCGDLYVASEVRTRFPPGDHMPWKKEKVRGAVQGMNPVSTASTTRAWQDRSSNNRSFLLLTVLLLSRQI